ncbi:MAG TPA: transglycosylase SLT domain-containing protein [Alphaproteobacteria bacterium]
MSPIPPVRPHAAATAPAEVRNAIREASARTGVSFDYLASQAQQESGFRSDARAKTSSAAGLYQFIESTWLALVREHGAKYGLGEFARAIAPAGQDGARVADPELRARILALRDDPRIAATMAAEYARDNQARLARELGREIGATDLYLAHFLGPNGAIRLLATMRDEPDRPAAELLPEAAAANRGVFFEPNGRPLSVREIYDRFAAKFDPGRVDTAAAGGRNESPPGTKDFGETRALEAVLRRTALAAVSGNILSPTVIAALAALDVPETASDGRESSRSGITSDDRR